MGVPNSASSFFRVCFEGLLFLHLTVSFAASSDFLRRPVYLCPTSRSTKFFFHIFSSTLFGSFWIQQSYLSFLRVCLGLRFKTTPLLPMQPLPRFRVAGRLPRLLPCSPTRPIFMIFCVMVLSRKRIINLNYSPSLPREHVCPDTRVPFTHLCCCYAGATT